MNIDEIRHLRETCECEVEAAMNRFKKETGLAIVSCDVRSILSQGLGQHRPGVVCTEVRLGVEAI